MNLFAQSLGKLPKPFSGKSSSHQPCAPLRFDFIVLFFLAIILSCEQTNIFIILHGRNLHDVSQSTVNFFMGVTDWRTFQNRVLGPAVVSLFKAIMYNNGKATDYARALGVYYYVATCITNIVLLSLALVWRPNFIFGFCVLMCSICFQIIMWTDCTYPWDQPEMILFSLLLLLDLKKQRSLSFFYMLFIFWVLTKETVIFIPIWLILTRASIPSSWFNFGEWLRLNKKVFMHSMIMFITSMIIIKLIRDHLFVSSWIEGIGNDPNHIVMGNFFMPIINLKVMAEYLNKLMHFTAKFGNYDDDQRMLSTLVVTGTFIYASVRFWLLKEKLPPQAWQTFLFMTAYFFTVFMAGMMSELRVWLPLVPMVLALYLTLNPDLSKR